MKTGFTTMGTPGLSLEEIVAITKEYGFDSVEIRVRDDGEIKPDITDEEAKKVKEILSAVPDYGLFCYNTTLHEGAEEMEKSLLDNLEIAEKTGAKRIRVFPGKYETEKEIDELIRVLKIVSSKYSGKVQINLQNHAGNGLSCEQGIKVINELNDDLYSFIFSPDECIKRDIEYMPYLSDIAKISRQMFIADISEDKKYTLIGEGCIPFKEVIEEMKRSGFDGYLTLKWEKCWCDYLPSYKEGFASFFNCFRSNNII